MGVVGELLNYGICIILLTVFRPFRPPCVRPGKKQGQKKTNANNLSCHYTALLPKKTACRRGFMPSFHLQYHFLLYLPHTARLGCETKTALAPGRTGPAQVRKTGNE